MPGLVPATSPHAHGTTWTFASPDARLHFFVIVTVIVLILLWMGVQSRG